MYIAASQIYIKCCILQLWYVDVLVKPPSKDFTCVSSIPKTSMNISHRTHRVIITHHFLRQNHQKKGWLGLWNPPKPMPYFRVIQGQVNYQHAVCLPCLPIGYLKSHFTRYSKTIWPKNHPVIYLWPTGWDVWHPISNIGLAPPLMGLLMGKPLRFF